MKRQVLIPALIFAISLSSGISYGQSGVKEKRNVTGFSEVSFGVAGNLFIKFGPEYEVTIEGSKNYIDNIITELSGDNLKIKTDNWRVSMNEKVNVYITMPEIEGLGVSGSGKAEITDPLKAEDLELSVSGSGKINVAAIDVKNLESTISGSGSINLSGNGIVGDAEISISGSGVYQGEEVSIGTLEVAISGSGKCYCNVEKSLEASISGSGNVVYAGAPRIDAHVSGSGHVRSR